MQRPLKLPFIHNEQIAILNLDATKVQVNDNHLGNLWPLRRLSGRTVDFEDATQGWPVKAPVETRRNDERLRARGSVER